VLAPLKLTDTATAGSATFTAHGVAGSRRPCARPHAAPELNTAIRGLLDELNARLMRKLGASRREFFESIDRPALLLPAEPYQYAEWRAAAAGCQHTLELRSNSLIRFEGQDRRRCDGIAGEALGYLDGNQPIIFKCRTEFQR
jgi:hypothetical protein